MKVLLPVAGSKKVFGVMASHGAALLVLLGIFVALLALAQR